jgi:hypothetical protein
MSVESERIARIRDRANAATPGPWGWFGNTEVHHVYLATQRWGRHIVMQFRRWGMQGAQPEFFNRSEPDAMKHRGGTATAEHTNVAEAAIYEVAPSARSASDPHVYRRDLVGIRNADATFIAHSREDVDTLLAEVDRLNHIISEGVYSDGINGAARQVGWQCEHAWNDPADVHMRWDNKKSRLVADKTVSSSYRYLHGWNDHERCPKARPVFVAVEEEAAA